MKKVLLLALFALPVLTMLAQNRTITGRVSDAEGKPVSFATVTLKGTTTAVSANVNGSFSIEAPAGSVLVFSAAGFQTTEVNIGDQTVLNTTLTSRQALSEVVVTALGITRSQKSLGYSASTIKSDELLKARETNIINSLAGKAAGVRITSQSGTVGGSSKIIIRGVNSVNNTTVNGNGQPIFVIDGLPIDNSAQQINTVNSAVNQGTSGADFGNRAGDINPDDVESITVLKGASATALYGARAKDGAIIITTKKGKKGQTSVTLNLSTRFDNALKLPSFQNEYAQGNQGTYNIASTNGWGPKISEVQDKTFPDFLGRQVTLKAYPDNVKDFYKTGRTNIYSVSFEGGGEGTDYRFGYTNTTQTGIIPGEKLNKSGISFNAGRNILKGLDIRTNINYTRTFADGRPVESSNNPNVLQSIILTIPRTVDINDVRENYVDPVTKQQITLTPGRTGNNPYWIINNNKFSNTVDRIYGNAIVTYSPVKWLTISDNIGTDFYNEFRKGVTRPGTIGALTGNFFTANLYNRIINNDLMVTVSKQLTKDLALKVIAGHNVFEAQYRREQSDAQSLTVDELYSFSNAGTVSTTNTSNKRRLVGVFGDIGLSYKDLLFVNATGRNDWSSTLPKGNNSYFYPSVSSSFIFSELLHNLKWLNYGKLRASWANVGSDAAPYALSFAYLPVPVSFAQYGFGSQFPFNGVIAFTAPGVLPNANLKPQNQTSYEIGTEMKFLQSRVSLDVTYYNSETKEQIINLLVPQSTGFTSKTINAGSVLNKGIEVTLGVIPVRTKDFSWNIDANFSKNKQTVRLPGEVKSYVLQSGWSGLQIKTRSGEPFAIWGTAWMRDTDGNIVIDANTGLRRTVNDQKIGNIFPDWMMGINNTVSFKNLSLSFLVDIRQGGFMYSNTSSTLRTQGLGKETAENRGKIFIDNGVILDPATNKYVPNTVPVQSMQDFWGQFITTNTEGNVYNASYVKLREVRLSYRLPSAFLSSKLKFIKGLELGLEGRNLWIIKSFVPNIDPEVNFFGPASLGEGVEFNSVPSTRTYGINLRIKI
ncbi:MAG TPA: SusC/RagA family TonB-linked outer membrane protein [Chitinophagaceae bacterium]